MFCANPHPLSISPSTHSTGLQLKSHTHGPLCKTVVALPLHTYHPCTEQPSLHLCKLEQCPALVSVYLYVPLNSVAVFLLGTFVVTSYVVRKMHQGAVHSSHLYTFLTFDQLIAITRVQHRKMPKHYSPNKKRKKYPSPLSVPSPSSHIPVPPLHPPPHFLPSTYLLNN